MQRVTGEMAKRFREFNWGATPIGPPQRWPGSWRTAVQICLASGSPTALALGPDNIYFYNDAFISLGGPARHPHAIGLPVREVWREIWHPVLESRFRETLGTGLPTGAEELMLPLQRSGYVEETYMTFSFAALEDEAGSPSGIFCTAHENTSVVITRRQRECLRRLAAECVAADSPAQACRLAAAVLDEQDRDVPFALFYLPSGQRFQIAYSAGLNSLPREFDAADAYDPDPCQRALEAGGNPVLIDSVGESLARVLRAGRSMPRKALALAVPGSGSGPPGCILVAGLNPLRPPEESSEFLGLVAAQLEKAIASAQMREHAETRARQLAELDRAKTTFFSNVSHELRTPLTLLLGPLRQVLDEAQLAPEHRSLLETARRAGGRLFKRVNSLLEFSRIEAGRINACYVPTALGRLTSDLAGMFQSLFELGGVVFVIDCPESEPAYVDPDLWEQIVLNLLSNALKFTIEGRVGVRLRQQADHFELEVADTGCGIAEPDLPRIFERFAPRSPVRARTAEGAGIGLSLVQELVRLHGGTVHARSRLGRGTTLTVRIPRGSSHLPPERIGALKPPRVRSVAQPFLDEALGWLGEDDAPGASPAAAPDCARHFPEPRRVAEAVPSTIDPPAAVRDRILVVDDNLEMRRYLQRLLEGAWQVQTAPDGAAALERIRHQRPDLVVADIMMPRVDGLEMLHALRSDPLTSDLPVLLLSARAGAEASVDGLHAGADDYLIKPFSRVELIARIEARLAQAKQRAAERLAREQVERNLHARDEFFAALAHELRSPVTSILMWSQALVTPILSRRRRLEALDAMDLAARTLHRLAEDLHDVGHTASAEVSVQCRLFASLTPLLEAATEAFAPAAAAKRIRIRTSLERDSGPVLVDAVRMQQVISNLLSNAVRYTPPGGWIEVSCARDADTVEVRVRDCGRGITAQALPHVFERYWRGKTVHEDGGLGLGLAIARRLLTLQGGQIEAASEGEGRGATFTVRLPVALAGSAAAEPIPVTPSTPLQEAARIAGDRAARQAASATSGS